MWGNFHFKTFDGDVYQFQGICEYNLVSHCHGSVQDFSVHVKRSEFTGDSKINRVLVTIGDMAIKLTKNLVMVNDDVVKLPHYVAGVLLEQYATYIKLYAKLGLSVMWNKDDAVMVELEAKYTNQTCGLCGDFNGMAILNEFISEAREIGPIEFGNKHRIHNPNSQCEDLYEEDEPSTPGKCQAFVTWKSCTSIVSPEPYIQACVVDRCWSRPGDIEDSLPLCTTLSEYSRQCSHAGGTPPNWRKPDFCAVKCPYNMEYSESGSPCVDTCSHTDTSLLCEEHKMDGCFCPPGTVFDDISDRGCIPQEQCQCKHNKVYNSGDVLVCHHGSWTCESLPTPGLCAVEEGSHFTTFDGKEFTFHGECYYILSQDCEESKFTVLGQLIPCVDHETDTCLKSVVLLPNNDKNNPFVVCLTANIIVFRPSSFHIIVQTSFGLRMQVQLVPVMQLYITLDRSYQTKTCGLCGNFNMVLSDELKTPQGLVEGTASSFANSWKAQSNCRDRSESLDDPCSYNIDKSYAEHWCSKLLEKEGPFAKCHSSVNPESYYKRCKYSTCTCEKTENCLCGVFSSYVRACTAKGIFLQGWRDTVCKKYTEHCPATQTFSYKLQGCQRTCDSLSLERPACINTYLPVEGCACPDGLYENENGVCVALDKCSCYHNGERIKPGKSITIKNEHCSFTLCFADCPAPKVFFNCSEAGPEEHGLECAKTCAQKTVDCCTSGCQCPSGLLDDGRGHCVPQHNCPCKHNGHYYPPGSQITDQCNTCTCKQGKWKCTEEKCPGTCTIYGSGHYNTFDNRRFGFSGDCGYIAAQNKCGNKTGTFHVITENVPCGTTGTTCSKSVRIVLGKTQLDLIDGKVTNTDLESGTLIKYRVRNVGLYLAIEADIGLTVLWDRKTTVRIILQPQHMGEVCGLCGNFNGNGKDDFTTQGQLQVSDVLEFANSWKVNSHCPDAVPDFDPCSKAHNRHTWAKMQCSIITGKTFKECHSMVDPAPYFDNCVRDSCACDTGGDCECFCTAVAAYAQACNEAGVCVAWRTPEICPVFCEFYNDPLECLWHYSPCHTPCYKTCLNPDGICRNPLPNLEGCYPTCPEDKPIFDEEKKICVEKCEGCFINGTEYETGEEIPSDKPCTLWYIRIFLFLFLKGCCFYNGTEYGDTDVIYNVTDNMGMCYYAICINSTVIETSEPCQTTPSTTPEPTTTFTTSTTEVSTTEVTSTTTITTTTPTPTSTTQTLPTPTVSQETTPCIICDWTEWFNVYDPVTGKGNDLETYENIRDAGKTICETPEDIECKAVSNPDMSLDEFVQETGQVVHCNVSFGLVCKKDDQENSPYKCLDYTIRALCCRPCESTPSPTTTITTPKETTTSQTTPYPGSEGTTPTTTRGTTTPEVITIPTTPHPGPTPTSTPTTTTTTTTRENKTVPCPTPTSSTTPNYDCPTWEQNETFEICNCTMARCIEDNIIEIIPYECPPLKNITCSNGKKPVLVWDENYCCEEYACDCFCEGWGDPHYKTFDGHFYSHQGNCTYVLMEEIRPKHNLKIYIDNVNCDPREFVSCPRALIVSYNGVVITLRNNNLIGAAKLEVRLNFLLGTGVKMIVEIPQLEAVLTFGVTGFSVNLPFRHFGENTQGHCGTCNNNKNDDCMLPGGKLIDDCAVMADYWPAKDLYNPDCPQPPTVPPTSAPTKKPCPANTVCELLKTDLFKECHPYVSPDNYFTGCQFDSCHVTNPAVVCTSLQTYASACSQFGVCLHWRNHTNLCSNCEGNKVYKPCGPAEPPTCQDKYAFMHTIHMFIHAFTPDLTFTTVSCVQNTQSVYRSYLFTGHNVCEDIVHVHLRGE
uniref:VWFD domain-containing protein n=1 Tax=Astyanax mexicanus TaxID=7994 RepID=A0A8B9JY28_ASTMX